MCLPIVESTTLGKKNTGLPDSPVYFRWCSAIRTKDYGPYDTLSNCCGISYTTLLKALRSGYIYATDVLPPNQSEYILTLSKLRVNQAFISTD